MIRYRFTESGLVCLGLNLIEVLSCIDYYYLQTCRKVLPFAAGCLFVFLVAFALYVNRVPPKYADKSKTLTPDDLAKMGIPLNGVDVPPEEASARASIPESEVVEEVVADEDEGETVEL